MFVDISSSSLSWLCVTCCCRLLSLQTKLWRSVACLEYFTSNQWTFTNDNVTQLFSRMCADDQKVVIGTFIDFNLVITCPPLSLPLSLPSFHPPSFPLSLFPSFPLSLLPSNPSLPFFHPTCLTWHMGQSVESVEGLALIKEFIHLRLKSLASVQNSCPIVNWSTVEEAIHGFWEWDHF